MAVGQGSAAQLQAMAACFFMRKRAYHPATIVSVGVGSAPEIDIWHWLLPKVQIVGIDPRHPLGNIPPEHYTEAAAGSGINSDVHFCRCCRSTACVDDRHPRRGTSPVVTVDSVASKYPGPYFLWMDCEGAEIEALAGASETLKQTRWLSAEVRDFAWDANYAEKLDARLRALGYGVFFNGYGADRLYWKRRFKGSNGPVAAGENR